jgi:hypothetical protein
MVRAGITTRRTVLVGITLALIVTAVAVWAYRASHREPSGCDIAHALIAYNSDFSEQMKSSTAADKASAVTPEQYRDWARRIKDYASQISDPELSGKAGTAADLAGRLADLVPRYRAKPDAAGATEYADLGIEYGNAINRLEYACLPAG